MPNYTKRILHKYYLAVGEYARYKILGCLPVYVAYKPYSSEVMNLDIITDGEEVLVPTSEFWAKQVNDEIEKAINLINNGSNDDQVWHIHLPIREQTYKDGKLWAIETGLLIATERLKFG